MDEFNIDFEITLGGEVAEDSVEKIDTPQRTRRATCLKRCDNNTYRRAYGETMLLDIAGFDFQDGDSYHILTGGDIDALSYLRVVLRQQDLEYLLFSTWCMASEDVYQLQEFLESGKVKKIDAYVGEIFPGSYKLEYALLKKVILPYGGRVAVFKNHSKIFAGFGEKFHFGIETSANINTNPRTENGCITIGKEIYQFYRNFFDGIKSFEQEGRIARG